MPRIKRTVGQPEERLPAGFEQTCGCEVCKLARFEGTTLSGAVVHNYSYKPRRWSLRKVRNDPYGYFLGVELETDRHRLVVRKYPKREEERYVPRHYDESMNVVEGSYRMVTVPAEAVLEEEYSRVATSIASDMARPKRLWISKHDSSISGVEFVSQPATLAFWNSKREELAEMFKMLLHAGYRSHDNDRCGMHINISRSAFTGADHLYRFLSLIHNNVEWSLRMSQRTRESANHWAKLTGVTASNSAQRRDLCRRVMRPWFGTTDITRHATYERYTALNMPYGEARFEFRLPRGTLRLDRFFKNLEWTVAMIEYTRAQTRLADGRSAAKFMAWVEGNSKTYPNLAAFIQERFGV